MDKIVMLPEQERAALFMETAGVKKVTPGVVEKDFWVVWVLGRLFTSDLLADKILFKGGGSETVPIVHRENLPARSSAVIGRYLLCRDRGRCTGCHQY